MVTQLSALSRGIVVALLLSVAVLAGARAEDYAAGEMALGDADAKVTIIEYASMTCPHCAAFHEETFSGLKAKYIDTGKVHFIFREFPLDSLAFMASLLARCAGEQQFFPMLDVLFAQQKSWVHDKKPLEALARLGKLGGVSREHFDACMNDRALQDVVLKNRMSGEKEHEVGSTPTFIINGDSYPGGRSLAQFDELLSKYLK